MIDPSMTDILLSDETPISLPMAVEKIKARDERIADLENKLSLKTQQWEFAGEQVREYAAQIESFEAALKENEWDFDGDTLQSLADFFNLTLEREYMVEITVRFSGVVAVPMDYDIDNLENELSAEISKSYYSNSAVDIDFMEEHMEISYEEV